MNIDGKEIRSKTRNFIISQLDGFSEFTNHDNLVDMGIVTEDFVLSLIQFLETEFKITISGDDGEYFYKNNLSITSIGKFINMQQKKEMKGKIELISEIKMCIVSIIGTQVLPIEVEFLEKLPYWNDELEKEFQEQLVERFNIDMDLSKMKPLTLDKIAGYIYKAGTETNRRSKCIRIRRDRRKEETETLDLKVLNMVIG